MYRRSLKMAGVALVLMTGLAASVAFTAEPDQQQQVVNSCAAQCQSAENACRVKTSGNSCCGRFVTACRRACIAGESQPTWQSFCK